MQKSVTLLLMSTFNFENLENVLLSFSSIFILYHDNKIIKIIIFELYISCTMENATSEMLFRPCNFIYLF